MALGFAKLGAGYFSTELNHAATRLSTRTSKGSLHGSRLREARHPTTSSRTGRLQVKMGAEGVPRRYPRSNIVSASGREDGLPCGQEALVIELLRTIGEEDLINRLPNAVTRPVIKGQGFTSRPTSRTHHYLIIRSRSISFTD